MNKNRIERILDSGYRAVLVTIGGGSTALNALLTTPGASRFVADAQIPYSPEALFAYLGEEAEQSCSPKTAKKLAAIAFEQSSKYPITNNQYHSVGISCTAALQTTRERRGADRAFICIRTSESEKLYALHFSKTSREEQEAFLSEWLLVLIAQAVGVERGLMLPGSFHPVHQGHCNLLRAAEEIACLHGVFELSSANVDKPELPEDEILRRAFAVKDIPVALTHAARFTQKAKLFPHTTFVLGYDTAKRLVQNDHTLIGMVSGASNPWKNQWETFQALETSFLVAGRFFQGLENDAVSSPRFQGLENLILPQNNESLFKAIPESKFREDISSTELRG